MGEETSKMPERASDSVNGPLEWRTVGNAVVAHLYSPKTGAVLCNWRYGTKVNSVHSASAGNPRCQNCIARQYETKSREGC